MCAATCNLNPILDPIKLNSPNISDCGGGAKVARVGGVGKNTPTLSLGANPPDTRSRSVFTLVSRV